MSSLHAPPSFAGPSVGALHDAPALVSVNIGDVHEQSHNARMDLDLAFEKAISEISSMRSTPPQRRRLGDVPGIIADQPLAA